MPTPSPSIQTHPVVLDIETAGLDAQHDWITCIGVLSKDEGIRQFTHSAQSFRTEPLKAEETILSEFFAWYRDHPFQKDEFLLTYNGEGFDVPFIDVRASIPKSPSINTDGFPPKSHTDLSKFVKVANSRYLSKDIAADHMADLYVPRTCHGGFLARIYKYRKVTDIQHANMLQHNAIDLATTMKMWEIFREYEDFDSWLLRGLMPDTITEHGDK